MVNLDTLELGARVTLALSNGEILRGIVERRAEMVFLIEPPRGGLGIGQAHGPLIAAEVLEVQLEASADELRRRRWEAQRGEPYPGRSPVTRADFEYRLEVLAKAAAAADAARARELIRQFNDVADKIELAAAKRTWLLLAGKWSIRNNAPPTLSDLWFDEVASPSYLARPRPQDFDPSPGERRKRAPYPADIAADPRSVPNVLSRLRRADFKARIVLAGDPVWDRAVLQIDLEEGRKGRFIAKGRREEGVTRWEFGWGGNYTAAGLRHRRRAERSDRFATLAALMEEVRAHA